MNSKSAVIKKVLFIIIPIALIAVAVIRLKSNKEITQKSVYQYDKARVINVQTDTIKQEDLNTEFAFTGTFEPYRESKISSEVQGKINSVLVDAGSSVKKGQALIILDNSLLKLQLKNIEVQIEGLQADVARYSILAKAGAIQGIQLEKAELGLKASQIQRASMIEQINKTTIRAPFDGFVTAKISEEGAFAAPGIPLLQITDIYKLKFTVNVAENDLDKFVQNHSYSIISDAYPEINMLGKTTMIGNKANSGSSYPVQFTLNNASDQKIKSGMFGKVNLASVVQQKGIMIPSSAIIKTNDQTQVYLVRNIEKSGTISKGKAFLQNITVSDRINNNSVIKSGLNEGDMIILSGFIDLFDGANVIIK
jgi:RND family efflux transporter MFP subunit